MNTLLGMQCTFIPRAHETQILSYLIKHSDVLDPWKLRHSGGPLKHSEKLVCFQLAAAAASGGGLWRTSQQSIVQTRGVQLEYTAYSNTLYLSLHVQ